MTDSTGPTRGGGERAFCATETAEIRTYILEMIDQLARLAAVHGQDDLAAALSGARAAHPPAPLN